MKVELNYDWSTMKNYNNVEDYWKDHEKDVAEAVSPALLHEWQIITGTAFNLRAMLQKSYDEIPSSLLMQMGNDITAAVKRLERKVHDYVCSEDHGRNNVPAPRGIIMGGGTPLEDMPPAIQEFFRRVQEQDDDE